MLLTETFAVYYTLYLTIIYLIIYESKHTCGATNYGYILYNNNNNSFQDTYIRSVPVLQILFFCLDCRLLGHHHPILSSLFALPSYFAYYLKDLPTKAIHGFLGLLLQLVCDPCLTIIVPTYSAVKPMFALL